MIWIWKILKQSSIFKMFLEWFNLGSMLQVGQFYGNISLKGQFQGQQTCGERGKKTLPAFAARLLFQQTRGERGEGFLAAFAARLFTLELSF